MDIRVLRYFLTVAREENITRAAESLHITQPSLSKQLMELEEELGKQLLVRGKRKLTLTDDGVLLRKRAEEIVALMEKTEQELSADTALGGKVSIGGLPGKKCCTPQRSSAPSTPRCASISTAAMPARWSSGSTTAALILPCCLSLWTP